MVSSAASSVVIDDEDDDPSHQKVANAIIIIRGDQEVGKKSKKGKRKHKKDRKRSEFEYVSFIKPSEAGHHANMNATPSSSMSTGISDADRMHSRRNSSFECSNSNNSSIPVARQRSSLQIQHQNHERNREVEVQDYSYSRDPMNGKKETAGDDDSKACKSIVNKCTLQLIKEKVLPIPDCYYEDDAFCNATTAHAITDSDSMGYEYRRLSPASPPSTSSSSLHQRSSRIHHQPYDVENDQRTITTCVSFRDPDHEDEYADRDSRQQDEHQENRYHASYPGSGTSSGSHAADLNTETYTVVKAIRHELNRFDSITYSHEAHDRVHEMDLGEKEEEGKTDDRQVMT